MRTDVNARAIRVEDEWVMKKLMRVDDEDASQIAKMMRWKEEKRWWQWTSNVGAGLVYLVGVESWRRKDWRRRCRLMAENAQSFGTHVT